MNPLRLFRLALCATLLPCAAAAAPPAADFRAGDVIAIIRTLASPALKGRASGEPGNDIAAQFIARQFQLARLRPVGTSRQRNPAARLDGSGYFQPFRFQAGRTAGTRSEVSISGPDGSERRLAPGVEFEPSGVSAGGRASGEILFAGYGIHAPALKHDDFAGLDLHGRIVLLLAGWPGGDPHAPIAEYAPIRRKAAAARDAGAVAVLVAAADGQPIHDPSPFAYAESSDAGLPVVRLRRPNGPPLAELIRQARAGEPFENETHVRATIDIDVRRITKVSANVVGLLPGTDARLRSETIVVGAHFDHLGMGGPGSLAATTKPAVHPGADDNASGTAGVIELARWFSRHPQRRSILFICFTGEELGLYGSDHYVKHPIIPLARTAAMLNMDMVGRLRRNSIVAIGSGTSSAWTSILKAANRPIGLSISPSESGFGASDQQSFYLHQIPVLFFFTGAHADYHRPSDTADKINAPGEVRVLKLVARVLEATAAAPARPGFRKIATSSPSGSAGAFHVYLGTVPDYAANVTGVRLNGVREGSPAAKAGLKEGDIIVQFGDRAIRNVYDYTYALQDHKPGDRVPVKVRRGRQTVTLEVDLAARPE